MSSVWATNPHLDKKMQDHWNAGLSASQCAAAIGHGTTRCSVVSRVHRLRLLGWDFQERENGYGGSRHKGVKKAAPFILPGGAGGAVSRTKQTSAPVAVTMSDPTEPFRFDDGALVTLETITKRGMCKYPIGDPTSKDFHLCGNAQKEHSPYCEFHHARCYVPAHPAGGNKSYDTNQGSARVFR